MSERAKILLELEGHLIHFMKTMTPNAFKTRSPELHEEWEDILLDRATVDPEAEEKGLLDNHGLGGLIYGDDVKNSQILLDSPRDTAKSTIAAGGFPIYHSIYFRDNAYTIIQCKTLGEAKKRLRKIADTIEYSLPFRSIMGYYGENSKHVVKWTEEKITIKVLNPLINKWVEWTFEAKGYGQPMRGMKEGDQRITLYIGDDVEDEENTKTEEAMSKNFNKFLVIKPGMDRRGKMIVIGTPIHQLCLVEKLKSMIGWVSKTYHTVDEENKTSLWEERLPYEEMITEKRQLESVNKLSTWYSERQCVITGDEDQLFKEEDLRYWDGYFEHNYDGFGVLVITHLGESEATLRKLEEPLRKPVNVHFGIDPASSVSKKADFSVTLPIAYDGRNLYALPYFERQIRPTAHADDIIQKAIKYKPVRTHVETVGYQEMLRDTLKRLCDEKNLHLPGISLKFQAREGSKDERIEQLEDFVREHKLHLKVGMDTFKKELILFPRGRKNILDAFYYGTRKLIAPDHTIQKKKPQNVEVEKISWMAA